jgi:hypothetical protein
MQTVSTSASRPVWQRLVRALGLAAAAGAFLAVLGAVETSQWPLYTRLLYWIPLMLAVGPASFVAEWLGPRLPSALQPPLVMWGVLALVLAVPITLFVWAYTSAFVGHGFHFTMLPTFFGVTFVITLAMTGIGILMEHPGAVTHAAPVPSGAAALTPAPRARFMERLPAKVMGGVLYAVKAEDHYLRLYTSKGEDLILMRLSDAIAELEGIEGAQTHRSWWVAKEAVQGVQRAEGKISLVLAGGLEVPVSRANVKPLKDAAWI